MTIKPIFFPLFFLFLVLIPTYGQANQTDRYLKSMPSVKKVMSDFQSNDKLDAAAQRSAAFTLLKDMMAVITDNEMGHKKRSQLYQQKHDAYHKAWSDVQKEALSTFDPKETGLQSPRARWYEKEGNYRFSPDFEKKILDLYFPPEWQKRYQDIKNRYAGYDETPATSGTTMEAPAPKKRTAMAGNQTRQIFLIALATLLIVVMPVVIFVVQKPYTLSGDQVHVRGRKFQLYHITGIVVGKDRDKETQVHSTGGGYDSTTGRYTSPTYHTTTTIHERIYLQDGEGKEHVIELTNWDLPVRPDHHITAIWAIRNKRQRGPYIQVLNHTTGRQHYMKNIIATMLQPVWKRWYTLIFLVLLALSFIPAHPLQGMYLWTWGIFVMGCLSAGITARAIAYRRASRFIDDIDFAAYA